MTKLNALVRNPKTNEATTIEKLDSQGLIKYESCIMETRKINGERKEVTKYHAVFIPSIDERGCGMVWEIGKMAYLSRTNGQDQIAKEFLCKKGDVE